MVSLNKHYNFVTIAPAELGGTFKNMKVSSIMTYKEATKYRDIRTLHEILAKHLANDLYVEDLTYILWTDLSGKDVLIPLEYIVKDSIVLVKSIKIVIEIPNANTEDLTIIEEKLTELGYYNCKIRSVVTSE